MIPDRSHAASDRAAHRVADIVVSAVVFRDDEGRILTVRKAGT